MNEQNSNNNDGKLEFNTYCIFTKEKQNIGQTIGLIFRDYLEGAKSYGKE